MSEALKIFLLICLIVLFIFSVWAMIFSIKMVKVNVELYAEFNDPEIPYNNNPIELLADNIGIGCVAIIFSLNNIFFSTFVPLKLCHFPKYIYKKYKDIIKERKAKNKEKKKQKLQQQLNALDKTEYPF